MPSSARVNGGDPQAAGRARQRIKLAAIGYVNSRHGVDTDAALVRAAVVLLCRAAIDFVEAISGVRAQLRGRRGDSEQLQLAAIAYAASRHGVDADVGMAREGMAMLCQAAIGYVESLTDDQPKRGADPARQIGNGARP